MIEGTIMTAIMTTSRDYMIRKRWIIAGPRDQAFLKGTSLSRQVHIKIDCGEFWTIDARVTAAAKRRTAEISWSLNESGSCVYLITRNALIKTLCGDWLRMNNHRHYLSSWCHISSPYEQHFFRLVSVCVCVCINLCERVHFFHTWTNRK